MSQLGPDEIRARRRPRFVLSLAALRLLFGACLAYPISALVDSSGVALGPDGDRVLFESGGYLLLELLRLQGGALLSTLRGLLPLLGAGLLLTALCNTALLVALNVRERFTLSGLLAEAVPRTFGVAALGSGALLAQVLLLVLGLLLSAAVPDALAHPQRTSLGQALVWLLVLTLSGAVGGVADVAKGSLVRYRAPLGASLTHAMRCMRSRPLRVCFGWLPPAVLVVALALGTSELCALVDVGLPGAARIFAVFALHQLVVLASTAARASWLAHALRLIATEVSG